jgi:hypothetical protein
MKIVTAFFDLGRSGYRNHSRSPESYVRAFLDGIAQIDSEIVIFVNKAAKTTLESKLEKAETKARITLIDLELDDLPLAKLKGQVIDVLSSSSMRFYSLRDALLPLHKYFWLFWKVLFGRILHKRGAIWGEITTELPKAPEYWHWEYLVLTWSKPWFMSQAFERKLVPEGSCVVWVDFGLGHSTSEFSQMVKGKRLSAKSLEKSKVHVSQRGKLRPQIQTPWDAAELSDDALVPAGLFAGDREACLKLESFFSDQIVFWLDRGVAPDDQVLLSMLETHVPGLVNLMPRSENKHGWYQLEHFLAT